MKRTKCLNCGTANAIFEPQACYSCGYTVVPEAARSGEARYMQRMCSRLTKTHRAESELQWTLLPEVMREALDRATWDIAWQVASSAVSEAATDPSTATGAGGNL